jgi:predicted secreted hydrolase
VKIFRAAGILLAALAVAAGALSAAWRGAAPGNLWSFPRDHWAHPEFRNEWWYFTGNLQDEADATRRYGYQFTVFRVGLVPEAPPLDSRWSAAQLFMGHAAAGDFSTGRHRFSDVLYRDIPLLCGFGVFPDARLAWSLPPAGTSGAWELRWNGEGFDFRMRDEARRLAFDLSTHPLKPLVLQGPAGYSRKGEQADAASLYYSFTRLETRGTLTLDGRSVRVRGVSWMDREMSTTALGADQEGWDWLGLRLEDGRDLMLYRLRQKGGAGGFQRGTVVDAAGKARYLEPEDWSVRGVETWTSPHTGTVYPARWIVEIPREGLELEVVPLLADQENVARRSANLAYWEGAVRLLSRGATVGEGYVELTGYGKHNRRRCEPGTACRNCAPRVRVAADSCRGENLVKMRLRWCRAARSILVMALAAGSSASAAPKSPSAEDWRTPAEVSGYRKTPRYAETMAYLKRLAAAAPSRLRIESFGTTGEGRDLIAVVASGDGSFDPAKIRRAGRPVVLIQNAIHAGEMDGKDSCLALLRDMVITKEKAALLERAVVVIIPIYNADGHERFGPFNRINQNGPEEMGWRTQSMNLNLNRDYMKADAPETRAFLKLWSRWSPDFFVDDHVTDGADYLYDVTYNLDITPDVYPPLAEWQKSVVGPYLEKAVKESGHAIGPLIFLRDDSDPAQGLAVAPDTPRYSTGYTILRNRPGMLVELHMLKDYKTRVTGNYELLRALLEVINRDAGKLVAMNRDADAATIAEGSKAGRGPVPIRLEASKDSQDFLYPGFDYQRGLSDVSGGMQIVYGSTLKEMTVPRTALPSVSRSVVPPRAYIVPAQWTSVIGVLEAHGLAIRRTTAPWTGEVGTYRCEGLKWQAGSYEGRQVLFVPLEARGGDGSQGACAAVREKMSFPKGSAVIPLDQIAARVAIHFLEPEAPDSAVAWGFFNAVFEQKEYGEAYVLEKLAREMMQKDPGLKQEFERKVASDKEFASDPEARLAFFYRRSPWWDPRMGLYPVGRLDSLDALPIAP